MRIIILGAPGAGKGTIAAKLAQNLSIPQISTGDIFREESRTNKELSEIMKSGKLVPDDFVNKIVEKRLKQPDCIKGFILDGYPRTIAQAEFLERKKIKIGIVINLGVSKALIVKRLSSRRTCMQCKAVYNLITVPPKAEGYCDKCGGKLIQRDDDMESTVARRIDAYNTLTAPLIGFYTKKGLLKEVDGNGTVDEVFENVLRALK